MKACQTISCQSHATTQIPPKRRETVSPAPQASKTQHSPTDQIYPRVNANFPIIANCHLLEGQGSQANATKVYQSKNTKTKQQTSQRIKLYEPSSLAFLFQDFALFQGCSQEFNVLNGAISIGSNSTNSGLLAVPVQPQQMLHEVRSL